MQRVVRWDGIVTQTGDVDEIRAIADSQAHRRVAAENLAATPPDDPRAPGGRRELQLFWENQPGRDAPPLKFARTTLGPQA